MLARKISNLTSIIEQTGQKVQELQQKKDTASQAEQKNLDQEIASLQKLIQQRTLDINKLEEQKARTEEKGYKAIQLTESERKELEHLTDQRIIELGVLRTQIQAHDSVKDAVQRANDTANEGLEKVAERRNVLTQTIKEIAKLGEMQEAKAAASSEDQKSMQAGIDQQKRLIASRQDELLALDSKRVKIEEAAQLANATTEQEVQGIKERTQALLAEIEVQRDSIKTTQAMGSAAGGAASNFGSLLASAGGLIGVVGGVSAITTALTSMQQATEAVRREMDGVLEASKRLTTKQIDTFASTQGAFAELGITDPKAKQDALVALRDTIPSAQNLTPDVVVRTAQGMGASLRAAGITDPNSARFRDIVGNASQAVYQGMDPDLVKNVFSDLHRDNKDVTGSQLNQRLSDLNAAAGSPRQANELMQIAQEQRSKYGLLGLKTEDIEKMFVSAGNNGIAPEARGTAIRGFVQGMDRFVGQTPDEYLKLYEKMTGVEDTPGQGKFISMMHEMHMSPEKILQREMTMRHQQTFGELDSLFRAGVGGKTADFASVARTIGGMSKDRMEQVMHAGGGPRASAGSAAVLGWSNAALPTGGQFAAPSTEHEIAASLAATSDFRQTNAQGVDPTVAEFNATYQQELVNLKDHIEYLPKITRDYNESSWLGAIAQNARHFTGGIPKTEQVAQSNAMATMFLRDAQKLRDMQSGKIKASKADIDALKERMQSEAMWISTDPSSNISKMAGGDLSSMPDMNNEQSRREWLLNNVDYQRNTQSLGEQGWYDFQSLGGTVKSNDTPTPLINPVLNPLPSGKAPPAPTTKPVSINYNTKQIIYGYLGDSISNMLPPANNYG